MSQRFLITWAALATLIAVAMTAFVLGKQVGTRVADRNDARSATEMPYSTQPGGGGDAAPEFSMPTAFANAPREWRSNDTADHGGYAALFDPTAREIIVEQCSHPGYPENVHAQPMDREFCRSVLSGWVASVTEEDALVQDRHSGTTVAVKIKANLDGDAPTLTLRFGDHRATLVPGSKNDLLQAVEKQPEIVAQKRRYLLALSGADRPRPEQPQSVN